MVLAVTILTLFTKFQILLHGHDSQNSAIILEISVFQFFSEIFT